ncbi:TetR/AcrR family transcriptional regulator [Paractinoplanes durhamensis]|uniref:TetR family transcriptional regulator n=1 Tax=Paractinoplanes durhamensis TaxID=113563 RepID=A0ABQ3YSX4_9ACTN|nr:TetR family transcriptional regulator [Actinoplanes durhamensis]GIE00643.1 TetR family transcriptional regulator [Actinoplanes durhamensis]
MRPASQEEGGHISGLRDLKRERNRVLTAETAWRLFIERGYDNVTVADICAAAEIAPRTFHRYFAGKDDVIAEPVRYMGRVVAEHVDAANPELSDVAVLRGAMHELGVFVVAHTQWLSALRTVIRQSSHLSAIHLGVQPEQEQDLSAALAARHAGSGEPGWRQRLLIAYAVAAFRIWYDDYLLGALTDPLARLDEMVATIGATGASRPDLGGSSGRD